MASLVVATLSCSNCGQEAEHELRYAGRIIASTRCRNCGYSINHEQHDLRIAYVEDLEQRVTTKPLRMLRRASRHPLRYMASLPSSVLAKPKALYDEVKPLLHQDGT